MTVKVYGRWSRGKGMQAREIAEVRIEDPPGKMAEVDCYAQLRRNGKVEFDRIGEEVLWIEKSTLKALVKKLEKVL